MLGIGLVPQNTKA